MEILAPVSVGELIDKIAILEIKSERIKDPAKLVNVGNELRGLRRIVDEHGIAARLEAEVVAALKRVNEKLWEVEDDIREHEARGDFGPAFVALARSVYILNDERATHKRTINSQAGSAYVEEKSYASFKPGG